MIPDAYDIAATLRTGYPIEPWFPPECDRCGEELGESDLLYFIDGEFVCVSCFEAWVDRHYGDRYDDDFDDDPRALAEALGVEYKEVDYGEATLL